MRRFISAISIVLLVSGCSPVLVAQPTAVRDAGPKDTLPIRYQPVGNLLQLRLGGLRAIQFASAFAYVGGQRFILGGTADAEQHLFVVSDSTRSIERLYWIQIEERLPTQSGAYDYSADSAVSIHGFSLAANTRTYTTPPAASSDRARAFALLTERGYRVPDGATRVRLVYIPDTSARREVMIIYLEPTAGAQTEVSFRAGLISRAAEGFALRGMP